MKLKRSLTNSLFSHVFACFSWLLYKYTMEVVQIWQGFWDSMKYWYFDPECPPLFIKVLNHYHLTLCAVWCVTPTSWVIGTSTGEKVVLACKYLMDHSSSGKSSLSCSAVNKILLFNIYQVVTVQNQHFFSRRSFTLFFNKWCSGPGGQE